MTDLPADRCLVPQAFWRALKQCGVTPAAVLRRAGLSTSLHQNAQGAVATAQLFAIWKAVEALTTDAGFGLALMEGHKEAGQKPALLAAHYAATYRDALVLLAGAKRYGACFQLRFEEKDGHFAIAKDWLFAREPEPALSAEMGFAALLELGRKGTGIRLIPVRMEFAHPDRGSATQRAFFGCPIVHDAARNLLVLNAGDLDLSFPAHNPELLDLLAPALAQTPSHFRTASFGERVRQAIGDGLAEGRPLIGPVAQRLAMSERTLQRRITEEGTNFRALLQDARREAARRLLADRSIPIDRVAGLLGYSNTSAFYRAFRAWEGITPEARRLGGGAGA